MGGGGAQPVPKVQAFYGGLGVCLDPRNFGTFESLNWPFPAF